MLEGISLDLAINYFSFLFFTSLVYKIKLQKIEFRLPQMLRLFNVFRETHGSENCAQLLEEEFIKLLNVNSLNDEHDSNIFGINFL